MSKVALDGKNRHVRATVTGSGIPAQLEVAVPADNARRGPRRPAPSKRQCSPEGRSASASNLGSNQARQRTRNETVDFVLPEAGAQSLSHRLESSRDACCHKAPRASTMRENGDLMAQSAAALPANVDLYLHVRVLIGMILGLSVTRLVSGIAALVAASRSLPDLACSPGLGRLGARERGHVLVVGISAEPHPALDLWPLLLRLRIRIDVLLPERPAFSSGSR